MRNETQHTLMTVHEAADFLQISASTLYGWAWQRRIAFVKVGRALRFEPFSGRTVRSERFSHLILRALRLKEESKFLGLR
jgi:excisionase family DNA binding protein